MIIVGMDVHLHNTVCDLFDPTAEPDQQHRIRTVPTTREGLESVLRPLGGRCRVVFEVGTQAQWIASIVRPLAAEVQVANPQPNSVAVPRRTQERPHRCPQAGDFVVSGSGAHGSLAGSGCLCLASIDQPPAFGGGPTHRAEEPGPGIDSHFWLSLSATQLLDSCRADLVAFVGF